MKAFSRLPAWFSSPEMVEGQPAWRREPERGSVLALGALSWLARHAPDCLTRPLIWLIALWFTVFPTPAARRGSEIYLRAVLERAPHFIDRFQQNGNFAHVILDRTRLLSSGLSRFAVSANCEETILHHHRAGRGGVLLGAHFGSFEALGAFDRKLPGLSVRYLMFQDNAPKSTRLLDALNPAVAAQVIPVHDGQGAMLAVRDALEAGSFVAFLGDRMPVRSQRGEIEVQFLGGTMNVPRAPYLCAILARLPLILCFAPRTGSRSYEILFSEVYDGAPVRREDRDALCRAMAQKYADTLSAMCRKYPYNWFNFFDIWGASPDGLRRRAAG